MRQVLRRNQILFSLVMQSIVRAWLSIWKQIQINHILSCTVRTSSSENNTNFWKLRSVCGIMDDLQSQESKQSYVRVYCTTNWEGKSNSRVSDYVKYLELHRSNGAMSKKFWYSITFIKLKLTHNRTVQNQILRRIRKHKHVFLYVVQT
jgi:hypothetical protein